MATERNEDKRWLMSFENPDKKNWNQRQKQPDMSDKYFKTVAIINGREIANFVASNVFIRSIEFNYTLEDAEEGIQFALENMEQIVSSFLQEDNTMKQAFQQERSIFVDNYREVLNLRLSAISERLDSGG